MKYLKLSDHAYVHGVLKGPDDGALSFEDDDEEFGRVMATGLADDVTADFAETETPPKPAKGSASKE